MKQVVPAWLWLLAALCFLPALEAKSLGVKEFCADWKDLPIRQLGRVKPLYVHSQQVIKHLTGKSEQKALTTYCQLAVGDMVGGKVPELMVSIEHLELQKLLALGEGKHISYFHLQQREEQLKLAARRHRKKDSYRTALEQVLGRITLYRDIRHGRNWMVPHKVSGKIQWHPLSRFVQQRNHPDLLSRLAQFLVQAKQDYQAFEGDHYLIELYYAQSHIHLVAMAMILVSIFLLVLLRRPLWGLLGAGGCVAVQAVAIVWRIMISQRAPVTNMYETVLFSGFAALVIALVIGHLRREKVYVLGGLGYNFLCSLMINFAHGMLSGDISPLVPVLRDNFWLSTHVTTVILSYAAFALAWMLANMALIKRSLWGMGQKEFGHQAQLIYSCLKVGTVLLALGVILGGIWADYSWGRFWGWDPKETWAAIALCLYLAILHGRYTNWMGPQRFVPAVAGAFMSIMMAWFGVNYILASGLHSYGFSQGGAVFLLSFFVLQIGVLVVTHYWRRQLSRG